MHQIQYTVRCTMRMYNVHCDPYLPHPAEQWIRRGRVSDAWQSRISRTISSKGLTYTWNYFWIKPRHSLLTWLTAFLSIWGSFRNNKSYTLYNKGFVEVISSDPTYIHWHVWFTVAPLKALSDKESTRYSLILFLKNGYF